MRRMQWHCMLTLWFSRGACLLPSSVSASSISCMHWHMHWHIHETHALAHAMALYAHLVVQPRGLPASIHGFRLIHQTHALAHERAEQVD